MTKKTTSQGLYLIFGVIIAVLIALIGYFAYLLISPTDDTATNSNTTITNNSNKNNGNTNSNKNKNKNSNTNESSNSNGNDNTNDDGLVEPDDNANANENSNTNTNKNTNSNKNVNATTADEVVAGEGEEVITLYFAKTGSDCGEVFPVKRAVTPEEDFYGQIMLADLAGPTDDESGYVSKATGVRLRWVEYGSEGSTIYVNEAYDELNACDQATVDAQLIQTANAMFDVAITADGQVVVGYPDEESGTDADGETTTNDNTNQSE